MDDLKAMIKNELSRGKVRTNELYAIISGLCDIVSKLTVPPVASPEPEPEVVPEPEPEDADAETNRGD